jgi:methionyl-tRNA synthetase
VKPIYITTSIAYINAEPHIGYLLELLSADILANYYEGRDREVFFLTGTDEHGAKVAQAAEAAGLSPQKYSDLASAKFQELGPQFGIKFDYFIRTTDLAHQKFVQETWQKLDQAGALERRHYTGLYCPGCEAFKTDRELNEGQCLIHHIPVEKIEEENWFFKLSQFREKILSWLESGPVVVPGNRRNEIINVVKDLEDVSISRPKTKVAWGIPVPNDESQVIYVWFDALFNYLSALEIKHKTDLWPADIQIIGKDILRFHAAVWPGLLLALKLPLPKKIMVHGFINVDGQKMSKSLGNVISPKQLLERYGAEATRYLLFRQLSYYDDSNFVWSEFDALYNGELANGLGNLVSRVITLLSKISQKNFNSVKAQIELRQKDPHLAGYVSGLEADDFSADLNQVNHFINEADQWITKTKPWEWLENDVIDNLKIATLVDQSKLTEIAHLLKPYLPETSSKIIKQLNSLKSEPLFPRLS